MLQAHFLRQIEVFDNGHKAHLGQCEDQLGQFPIPNHLLLKWIFTPPIILPDVISSGDFIFFTVRDM